MFGFIIVIHLIVCILLIVLILIQRGRGGGLVETLSDFESMFGPKTNTLLNRLTTVLAVIFLFTCLILAFLSAKQSRSLMEDVTTTQSTADSSTPLSSGQAE